MKQENGKVISIEKLLRWRKNITIANNDSEWQNIKASFSLSGLETTDQDAEIAGRLLSGQITLEEGIAEIKRDLGLEKK